MDDSKRKKILVAATELFLADGFERVSIDAIAKRARASKTTIYSRFPTKEELFNAVVEYSCSGADAPSLEGGPPDDLRTALCRAAQATLYPILTPRVLQVLRLSVGSVAYYPKLARYFWERGPKLGAYYIAEALARLPAGRRPKDVHKLGVDYINRVSGTFLLTALLDVDPIPTKKEIDAQIESAIDNFISDHRLE